MSTGGGVGTGGGGGVGAGGAWAPRGLEVAVAVGAPGGVLKVLSADFRVTRLN